MTSNPPAGQACPVCRGPLSEIVEGFFRCRPCGLVPNRCVCPPAVASTLDDFLLLAGTGIL